MVIAPDCGSGGPGFDSRWPPFFFEKGFYFPLSRNIGGWQLWHSPALGPSPSGKAQAFDACSRWFESNWPCYETLAQSVEHLTFNQVVAGSIPACLIPFLRVCGCGGIGRRARFRFWWATVQVQVLSSAVRK